MLDGNICSEIKQILENDGVIAFVTDTVWGLGCLPNSSKAVKRIYEIKHRDPEKPLILMSYDTYPLLKYVQPVPKSAQILMKKHFPGALTLVLNKSDETPDFITSGTNTVGIRVPDNEVFSDICKVIDGHVLATTSANLSSQPPALDYDEAIKYIGSDVDLVVPDCGLSAKGTASTVAGVFDDEIKIFRQGDIHLNM
ncbi:MAG: threonylcarbamoyl-AMP synthase [Cyanobacteria bacterium RUI128]|nr:threonylcarbamoyl-AMP synthase [Cyanobacteria bacterium RUI128]